MTDRDGIRRLGGVAARSDRLKDVVASAILVLAAVWVLFPFYWAAITSLKSRSRRSISTPSACSRE